MKICSIYLTTLALFCFIFCPVATYKNSQKYSQGSETGIIRKSTNSFSYLQNVDFQYNQFKITYESSFQNAPKFIIGIVGLRNCPHDNQQHIRSYNRTVSTTTIQIIIEGMIWTRGAVDSNSEIVSNYMLIDVVKNSNVQIIHQSLFNTANRDEFLVSFTNIGVNETNTRIIVVLRGFYCYKISGIFYYLTSYVPMSQTTVKVIIETNGLICSLCINRFFPSYSVIVIRENSAMFIASGQIKETPNVGSASKIKLSTISSSYFIGMTEVNLPDSCFNFGLNELQSFNSFDRVEYSYFSLAEKQVHFLAKIICHPFRSKIQFVYSTSVQLTTVSFNPSAFMRVTSDAPNIFAAVYFHTFHDKNFVTLAQSNSGRKTRIRTQLKIVFATSIIVKVIEKSMEIIIHNTHLQTDLSYFKINDTRIEKSEFIRIDENQSVLKLRYYNFLQGDFFQIQYFDALRDVKASQILTFADIVKIDTFSHSYISQSKFILQYIPFSNLATHQKFQWRLLNVQNITCLPVDSSEIMQCSLDYISQKQFQDTLVKYYFSVSSNMFIQYLYKSLILKQIQTSHNSDLIKLTFFNTFNFTTLHTSDFKTNDSSFTLESVEISDKLIILVGRLLNYFTSDETPLQITISDPLLPMSTHIRFNKYKQTIFDQNRKIFKIVLGNSHQLDNTNISILNISSSPNLSVQNISIDQNNVTIEFMLKDLFAQTVAGQIRIAHQNDKVFKQVINIELQNNLCSSMRGSSTYQLIIELLCYSLTFVYLATFVLSIFSCQKLFGIELMFLIQLAYYSLIQLDIKNCSVFPKLSRLRSSTGAISLSIYQKQSTIPQIYNILNIQPSLFQNVNVCMSLLLICPIAHLIIKLVYNKSKSQLIKYRCKKYEKSFFCEVPLTILLFNSFNVYTSAIINFQLNSFDRIFQFGFSLVFSILLPIYIVIFLVFQNNFVEFTKQFDEINQRCFFNKKISALLRRLYSVILILQFILTPIILTLPLTKQYSFYLVLVIESVITLCVCIIPTYANKFDNIRNYFHRFIVVSFVIVQILFWNIQDKSLELQKTLYHFAPFAIIGILFIGFSCTGVYIIIKSIKFWKHSNPVQQRLKAQKQGKLNVKPLDSNPPPRQSNLWVPVNWYKQKSVIESSRSSVKPLKLKQMSPSQKILLWFEEMQDELILQKLGFDKDFYIMFKNRRPSWFQKQKLIREAFHGVNLDYILQSLSLSIFTIDECLVYLGETKCRQIKQFNQKKYSKIFTHEQV